MRIAMYDFLGYYDICYIGGEVRNPERVLPRAIILSVIFVALIYAVDEPGDHQRRPLAGSDEVARISPRSSWNEFTAGGREQR